MAKVIVREYDKSTTLEASHKQSLLDVLKRGGILIHAPCGGKCLCGKCKVLAKGDLSKIIHDETRFLSKRELSQGMRLACAAKVLGDVEVVLTSQKKMKILADLAEMNAARLDPKIKQVEVQLPVLSSPSCIADDQRVLESLKPNGVKRISKDVLTQLPRLLHDENFDGSGIVCKGTLIALNKGKHPHLGLAVDIGTTTMVAYLVDLMTGKIISHAAEANPQRAFGADVISRMDAALSSVDSEKQLHQLIKNLIYALAEQLCQTTSLSVADIHHVVLTGNTVMMHFAASISTKNIAKIPFVPGYTHGFSCLSSECGYNFEGHTVIEFLPCLAGFVGADTLCGVLATGLYKSRKPCILIDIGTNGEMVIGNHDKMISCSTAAGPAFEGAQITFGMPAMKGAIYSVKSDSNDKFQIATVDQAPPVGICGSGLLDATACLLDMGLVHATGKMGDIPTQLLAKYQGKTAVILTNEKEAKENQVLLTQRDIREVQLAKGAIAAGIEILLEASKINLNEIETVYLAGGFGNWLNPKSACRIGLLPYAWLSKIRPVGNSAATGAVQALLSRHCIAKLDKIRTDTSHVELSTHPKFQDLFANHMLFPEKSS